MARNERYIALLMATSATAFSTAFSTAAISQQPAQPPEIESGDIVVTAQKRSETLQNVPISITAMTGDALASRGQDDFSKFSKAVPGLSFIDLGPGQSQISIRGINTGAVARDDTARKESVGVYLNEVPISVALFNPDLDTYDLARVEVLRGPQGTLYGAGSLAGTVRLIANEPSSTKLEAKGDATLSQTRGSGDPNYQVKGAVNLPVVTDMIGVRAVGYYDHDDGFIDNIGRGVADVNSSSRYGVRLSALITPDFGLRITPGFVWQKIGTHGFPIEDVQSIIGTTNAPAGLPSTVRATPDPLQPGRYLIGDPIGGDYTQYRQHDEGLRDDFKVYSLQLDYDFGPAKVTSVSALLKRDLFVQRDLSFFMNSIFGGLPSVNYGIPITTLDDRTHLSTFTQELRLSSSAPSRLDWVAGIFYQREQRRYGQTFTAPGFEAQTGLPVAVAGLGADVLYRSDFDLSLRQYAIFGEGTFALTDRLKATAGLRWYDYSQSRDARLEGLLNDLAVTDQLTSTAANGVNPRFLLSYRAARDVMISLQASKGFKLGGPADPLLAICKADAEAAGVSGGEFKPETLWNYELGVKSSFAGGRITVNGAAFRIDYSNLQLNRRLPCSFTVTTNAGKARSEGLELEVSVRPIRGLSLSASGSYVDAKIRGDQPTLNARSGDRLPLSPKLSFSTNGRYTVPVIGDWDGFVDATYQYVGSVIAFFNSDLSGAPPIDAAGNKVGSYGLVNLRIGASGPRYEIALFADNLLDKRAALTIDRERVNYLVTGNIGRDARLGILRNRPRTIGVNVKAAF